MCTKIEYNFFIQVPHCCIDVLVWSVGRENRVLYRLANCRHFFGVYRGEWSKKTLIVKLFGFFCRED